MGEVTLWASATEAPHDGAAGWRHNHGGCDGPGRRRNRRDLAVVQDRDAGHDGQLDAHRRTQPTPMYMVMEGDTALLPARDGDVHGRGGHGYGHGVLAGDHDGGRDGRGDDPAGAV